MTFYLVQYAFNFNQHGTYSVLTVSRLKIACLDEIKLFLLHANFNHKIRVFLFYNTGHSGYRQFRVLKYLKFSFVRGILEYFYQ